MPGFSKRFLNSILNTGASELNREVQRREDVEVANFIRSQKLADIAADWKFKKEQLDTEIGSREGISDAGITSREGIASENIKSLDARAAAGLISDKEIAYARNKALIEAAKLRNRGSATDSPTAKSLRARIKRAGDLHDSALKAMSGSYDITGDFIPPNYKHAQLFADQYNKMRDQAVGEGFGNEFPELDLNQLQSPPEEGGLRMGPSGANEQYISGAWRELNPESYNAISQQGGTAQGLVQSAGLGVPQAPAPAQQDTVEMIGNDGNVYKLINGEWTGPY